MKRHNNIKRSIIESAVRLNMNTSTKKRHNRVNEGLSVLDCGCGRGGDLFKWAHVGASHYTGIDISHDSIDEAKKRASKIDTVLFNFHAMSFESFIDKEPTCKYDVISLQFVIHYIVDSDKALDRILEQCRNLLSPTGVIIGTMVNDKALVSLIHDLELDKKNSKPDNQYMNISVVPDQDKAIHETGYMYQFFLHNCVDYCIEYVVPWEKMEESIAKNSMKVDYCLPFSDTRFVDDELVLHKNQEKLSAIYCGFKISMCT